MAKLVLTDITSGYASTTALNANNALIEAALENTLSRDGTTPNTMSADLDMNGNSILNVGDMLVGGVGLAASVTAAAASAAAADVSADAALASEVAAAASEAIVVASADNLADLEYMGAWTAATAYLKNNIVYYSTDGSSYICLVSHTSHATDFSVDLGLGYWGLLATRGAAGTGTGDMLKSENLSGLANYTTARSNLGLTIGTHVQAYDAQLDALAGITAQQATDLAALSTFMGTVLDDASGDAAFTTLGAAKSLVASGYQKLPSGLIIQWGGGQVATATTLTVTLPIAFPTAFFQVVSSHTGTSEGVNTVAVPNSLTSVDLRHNLGGTANVTFLAIGH